MTPEISYNNDYTVIESGSAIISTDDFLEFKYENLRFRFLFQTEENSKSTIHIRKQTDEAGQTYMAIVFVNTLLNNFSSFCPPVAIANFNGKEMRVMFALDTLVGEDFKYKRLSYTWLLQK